MTQFQARTVAFIGLGLISGSLARALRGSTWRGKLIAWGPREASLKRGRALGVVDDYSLALDEVIEQADVIVVGAPPAATASVLRDIMGTLAVTTHQPIITDLASIKGYVVDSVPYDYPHFVPGHPIAGSEHSGVEHSDAGLFTCRSRQARARRHFLDRRHGRQANRHQTLLRRVRFLLPVRLRAFRYY